jgi:hypothetical protein
MKAIKPSQNRNLANSDSLPPEAPIKVIHRVRGRVRLKVRGLRSHHALRSHLEKELSALHGIHRVSASTATGNLLVHHEEQLAPKPSWT